jgi:PAS domain S-box-containing protein
MTDIFRQMFDSSPDGILQVDAQGCVVLANRCAETMFGYDPGQLAGTQVEELMPPRHRPLHDKHRGFYMSHSQSRPMGLGMNLTGMRRNGSEFPIEVGLVPMERHHGGERVVVAFVRDVSPTDRGQASFKRSRYQEYLRRFSQDALTDLDFEKIVQRTPELLGEALNCESGVVMLLAKDRREFSVRAAHGLARQHVDALARTPNTPRTLPGQVAQAGEPQVYEDLQHEASLDTPPALQACGARSALGVPLHGDGQVLGVIALHCHRLRRFEQDDVSFVVSIGHLVSAALERQRQHERLAQGQKMEALGQLTGGVAHDFNNILTVVLGNLQLLDDALGGQPHERRLALAAAKAARRGADLTRKLLAFARKQPMQPVVVVVDSMLADLVELLRRTLGESIRLRGTATEPGLALRADAAMLETAMLNLALNARDAMPKGGALTVTAEPVSVSDQSPADVRELAPGSYVQLSVTDTGLGMDPAVRARIFEPFFTTKGARGNGLGLAMVYGFASQSGGGIFVYSEPGQGTTFKMYLPRVTGAVPGPAAAVDARIGGRERVLVVEDDADVRALALSFLGSLGYSVEEAGDVPEALALLQRDRHFDLLFSDVVLPGTATGPQLALQARQMLPGLAVLLTSGYPRDALSADGHLLGRIELLSKPYSREDLAQAVRRALDRVE